MMSNLDVKHCSSSTCKVTIDENSLHWAQIIDENNIIGCSGKIEFRFLKAKTPTYGLNSIRSLRPRIWKLIQDDLKKIDAFHIFKLNVNTFQFKDCLCKICKDYI